MIDTLHFIVPSSLHTYPEPTSHMPPTRTSKTESILTTTQPQINNDSPPGNYFDKMFGALRLELYAILKRYLFYTIVDISLPTLNSSKNERRNLW